MHFSSRKKFCMSIIINALVVGEMVIDVFSGPSVVGIVILVLLVGFVRR